MKPERPLLCPAGVCEESVVAAAGLAPTTAAAATSRTRIRRNRAVFGTVSMRYCPSVRLVERRRGRDAAVPRFEVSK